MKQILQEYTNYISQVTKPPLSVGTFIRIILFTERIKNQNNSGPYNRYTPKTMKNQNLRRMEQKGLFGVDDIFSSYIPL